MIMIDPLFATLAGGLLASALSGVVGNRADSLVITSYKKFIEMVKKGKNPDNHALQKAIKRSYLQALLKICGECLEKLKANKKENSSAIEWLEEKTKNLNKQFENVETLEYYDVPNEQLSEIELLVTPQGALAGDRIKNARLKLVRSALEDSGIPDCFRKKVREGLFEEVCNFFASELKDNPRVQVIFESQLLAKILAESEGIKITLEQIVASLQEISKIQYKLEKKIFTIEEYSRLSYIQPLLQYVTFIGRDDELRKLHRFLESDKKIMVMSGDGGVGKTKVSLEFAKQVKEKGEWNIYYINPDIIVVEELPPEEKILLILDDASDTVKRDHLVASVSTCFPHEEKDLKLLLINRPIYNEAIRSFITQRNIPSTFLTIEKGDIIGFLKEYGDWIDDKNAKKIEENCLNSFDFAIFFAEYFREKGEIGKAYDVIKWKVERYIKDIAAMSSINIVETRETIQLMSLLTPIYWDDIEHIRKLPILKNKDSFEKVLRVASNSATGIVFSEDDDKYVIKPDPLADFLRLEYLNNDKFEKTWRRLLPYTPLRISHNIVVLLSQDIKDAEKAFKILSQTWDELNSKCGKTPEYFLAIVFFTGDLSNTGIFDWNKINLRQWVKCYDDISERYPEERVRDSLAMGLVNSSFYYVKDAPNSEKMGKFIDELRELYEKHPDKEIKEKLAMSLINAINHHGNARDFNGMEKYIDELRGLNKTHPENEVKEELAMGLVNATNNYGKALDFEKMEKYIDELRGLNKTPPENEVREKLAEGFVNATKHYGKVLDSKKMENYLEELRELHKKYPETEESELLSKGLFNAILHYAVGVPNSKLMEKYTDELRELYEKHQGKEVREHLAQCFVNVIIHYEIMVLGSKMMEEYLNELRELYEKYEEKEVGENFAKGLVNAMAHYGKVEDTEKMEKCIDELRELHKKYPETELRKRLAEGLFNMTVSSKAVDTEKMEKYFDELSELYKKYPEKEVREQLSKGLFNVIKYAIKQPYENFILLYKLRFDLPDNKYKEVEIKLIEETRDEIQSKYNKNNKSITDFVKNLHLALNNETELVILIDRVAEKLPIKIQKSLYEALNELGL